MKQRDKWEDYVSINLKELAFEDVGQDNLAQDSVQ